MQQRIIRHKGESYTVHGEQGNGGTIYAPSKKNASPRNLFLMQQLGINNTGTNGEYRFFIPN